MCSLGFIIIILSSSLFDTVLVNEQCELFYDFSLRPFHKVKTCYRSDLPVITRSNVQTIEQCYHLARERGGLAINFSPPAMYVIKSKEDFFFQNCHILECPEFVNSTTLVNDTSFDYYSLYGNLDILDNTTCVKSVGVFRTFDEKVNYTTAISKCQSIGGDLAHIISEARTNGISTLVSTQLTQWYKVAFVGLDDLKSRKRFETPLGDLLNCYKFRAWGPGHPRHQSKNGSCVIIDSNNMWKVVDCKLKLPFVCELFPTAKLPAKVEVKIDCSKLKGKNLEVCRKQEKGKGKYFQNYENKEDDTVESGSTDDESRCEDINEDID